MGKGEEIKARVQKVEGRRKREGLIEKHK